MTLIFQYTPREDYSLSNSIDLVSRWGQNVAGLVGSSNLPVQYGSGYDLKLAPPKTPLPIPNTPGWSIYLKTMETFQASQPSVRYKMSEAEAGIVSVDALTAGVYINLERMSETSSISGGGSYGEHGAGEGQITGSSGEHGAVMTAGTLVPRDGNKLYGGKVGDVLVGSRWSDSLFGKGGNDHITGGQGADHLDGGAGVDTLDYSRETGLSGVTVDLTAGTATDTFGDRDTLRLTVERQDHNVFVHGAHTTHYGNDFGPFENVRLTRHDDVATGNGGANVLYGLSGNDTLNGAGGNDILVGGHGRDSFSGGEGADRFVFRSAEDSSVGEGGRDVVRDFQTGSDTIDVHAIAGGIGLSWVDADHLGAEFSGRVGQMRYAHGHLQADLNGDGRADFEVIVHSALHTTAQLVAGDVLFA